MLEWGTRTALFMLVTIVLFVQADCSVPHLAVCRMGTLVLVSLARCLPALLASRP